MCPENISICYIHVYYYEITFISNNTDERYKDNTAEYLLVLIITVYSLSHTLSNPISVVLSPFHLKTMLTCGQLVFSDESCSHLCPHNQHWHMWRLPRQHRDPAIGYCKEPQYNVLVRDNISFDNWTPLASICDTFTAHRCIDKIL